MQSLADTAEQRRQTIDRLAPIYEQSEVLKKSVAGLENQVAEYQARESQWVTERASLTERTAELEITLATLQSSLAPLEAKNQGILYLEELYILLR